MRIMGGGGGPGATGQGRDAETHVPKVKVKLPDGASYATNQLVWLGGSLWHLGSALLPPGHALPDSLECHDDAERERIDARIESARTSPAALERHVASARACAVALRQPSGQGTESSPPQVGPTEPAVWERASMSINLRITADGPESATMEEMAICQACSFLITALPMSTIRAVVGPAVHIRECFLKCSPLLELGIPPFFSRLENNLAEMGMPAGVRIRRVVSPKPSRHQVLYLNMPSQLPSINTPSPPACEGGARRHCPAHKYGIYPRINTHNAPHRTALDTLPSPHPLTTHHRAPRQRASSRQLPRPMCGCSVRSMRR